MELTKYQSKLLQEWVVKQEYTFIGRKSTVCCITLVNGYEVIGTSAPINPLDFDKELGKKIALSRALDKVAELEGFIKQMG